MDLNRKMALGKLPKRSLAPVRNPLPREKLRKENCLCARRRQSVWKCTRKAEAESLINHKLNALAPPTSNAFLLVLSDSFPQLAAAFYNLHPQLSDIFFGRFCWETKCHEIVYGLPFFLPPRRRDIGQRYQSDQPRAYKKLQQSGRLSLLALTDVTDRGTTKTSQDLSR